MAFHKEQLTEPCRAAPKTVQIKHVCITMGHTITQHTQSIVRLTKQSPPHVHHRLPATLVTPFMSELQDKSCLASASTHRHACRCSCVPVLLRLRAYRGLHPPCEWRKGGDPPPLPSLPFRRPTLPGQWVPHCRTRGPLTRNCGGTLSSPANTATLATAKALLRQWPKGSDTTRPPWPGDPPAIPCDHPGPHICSHANSLPHTLQPPASGPPTAASEDTSPRATDPPPPGHGHPGHHFKALLSPCPGSLPGPTPHNHLGPYSCLYVPYPHFTEGHALKHCRHFTNSGNGFVTQCTHRLRCTCLVRDQPANLFCCPGHVL